MGQQCQELKSHELITWICKWKEKNNEEMESNISELLQEQWTLNFHKQGYKKKNIVQCSLIPDEKKQASKEQPLTCWNVWHLSPLKKSMKLLKHSKIGTSHILCKITAHRPWSFPTDSVCTLIYHNKNSYSHCSSMLQTAPHSIRSLENLTVKFRG